MSIKLFFETHGRFPTTDEFRLIRTFKPHQPDVLSESTALLNANRDNVAFNFVRAARHGDLEKVKELADQIHTLDNPAKVRQPGSDTTRPPTGAAPAANNTAMRQGPTALCAAAQGDHLDVISFLIDRGAGVDYRPTHNRTALLFASESGHFNAMNYLISRGATYFTYSDQQIESYYMSYTIRQSITRRELSYILPGDLLPGIVLDYLGLGGHRIRAIERLAPVNLHNKTAFGARPIPDEIVAPVPKPHPCPVDLAQSPIVQITLEEYHASLEKLQEEMQQRYQQQQETKQNFVDHRYPQHQNEQRDATNNNILDTDNKPQDFQPEH